MDAFFEEILDWGYHFFTIEKITAISVIAASFLGAINIWLLRKSENRRQDDILFNAVIYNLDNAIAKFLGIYKTFENNGYAWAVFSEQLSVFHNLGCLITDRNLRKCYCGKLHSYIFSIRSILSKINDYRFFYGILDYKDKSAQDLFAQSRIDHSNISPNTLGCLLQFIALFHGIRADYMSHDYELDKILQPVYPGFKDGKDNSEEQIDRMSQPFKNIYTYINEWSRETNSLRKAH